MGNFDHDVAAISPQNILNPNISFDAFYGYIVADRTGSVSTICVDAVWN